jgi:hypothetical protein
VNFFPYLGLELFGIMASPTLSFVGIPIRRLQLLLYQCDTDLGLALRGVRPHRGPLRCSSKGHPSSFLGHRLYFIPVEVNRGPSTQPRHKKLRAGPAPTVRSFAIECSVPVWLQLMAGLGEYNRMTLEYSVERRLLPIRFPLRVLLDPP